MTLTEEQQQLIRELKEAIREGRFIIRDYLADGPRSMLMESDAPVLKRYYNHLNQWAVWCAKVEEIVREGTRNAGYETFWEEIKNKLEIKNLLTLTIKTNTGSKEIDISNREQWTSGEREEILRNLLAHYGESPTHAEKMADLEQRLTEFEELAVDRISSIPPPPRD